VTDHVLRRGKDLVLGPVAAAIPGAVHPTAITAVAVVPGLGAAAAAAAGRPLLALALWLLNRLLDGLDGTLARHRGLQSALGAYADILLDVIVYAAIPLGVAADQGTWGAYAAAAVLLANFYVNAISWAYLSALLERRGAGAKARGEATAVSMPPGLIEGAETIVLFALALALPQWSTAIMWGMAAGVAITIGQRALWACRNLRDG
jgi:phosphatidylglycerophosphate synthase